MRARFIIVAIALVALIPCAGQAQTIRLQDGSEIEGEITAANEERVVVTLPGLGKVVFERSEIASSLEGLLSTIAPNATDEALLSPERSISLTEEPHALATVKAASGMTWFSPPQPAPRADTPAAAIHDRYQELARKAYRSRGERSVRYAQQALEYALRHGMASYAKDMRRLIRQEREGQQEREELGRDYIERRWEPPTEPTPAMIAELQRLHATHTGLRTLLPRVGLGGIGLLLLWGFVRVYYGSGVGVRLVWKQRFSFKDGLVNLDDILRMSRIVLAIKHPQVKRQLEQMGILETTEQARARLWHDIDRGLQRLFANIRFR